MIILIVMVIAAFFSIRFIVSVAVYGDDSHFYVLGSHRMGLLGIVISVLLGIVSVITKSSMAYPAILLLICLVLLYVNASPVLQIDGDEGLCVTFRDKVKFDKKTAKFESADKTLNLEIDGKVFKIYRDSINFDRLIDWL